MPWSDYNSSPWEDAPSTATPLSAARLNAREAHIAGYVDQLAETATQVNVKEFGAVGDGVTNDRSAFNNAITEANIVTSSGFGSSLVIPPGVYNIGGSGALNTLTNAQGIVGTTRSSQIIFNTDSDCFVLKGSGKFARGLFIRNDIAAPTARRHVFRIQNCANGTFENVWTQYDGANGAGITLEHVYDGSAADAEFIVHLGCWENWFLNCSTNYGQNGSTFANVGWGITFITASSALGVVNPPGQPAGTYNGSVKHARVFGHNAEGKARGIHLQHAYNNTFVGGHLIGNTDQVWGDEAHGNLFMNIEHNQYGTGNAYNLNTSNSFSNMILWPRLANAGQSQPWEIGNIGARPMLMASDEGAAKHGFLHVDSRMDQVEAGFFRFGTRTGGPGGVTLRAHTVATRPTAANHAGSVIYVSDASAGQKLQYSDGSAWVAAG